MTYFEELYQLDVNGRTEKKNGLTYLSWAYAWAEIKKRYPNASYTIKKFDNDKPYVYDELTGYMVFTTVTIEDSTHEMWLPVMDGANKAMKHEPYTYKVKDYKNRKWTGDYIDKSVEAATMFDINKTIMRCLVKNLAMHGLGLYIYAGEDIPENEEGNFVKPPLTKETAAKIVLGFGKNKGMSLGELFENDMSYINWLDKNEKTDKEIKEAIKILKTKDDTKKTKPVVKATEDEIEEYKNKLIEYATITGNADSAGIEKVQNWGLGQAKAEKFEDITKENLIHATKVVQAAMSKAQAKNKESLFDDK